MLKNVSIPLRDESCCEFIDVYGTQSPLISKCEIKVCYVSDEPNRNGSIITKNTALQMAKTLPGCPIVGFYNKETEDFEEHNKSIELVEENGQIVDIKFTDNTFPFGFVDLHPRVWFQKFNDNGVIHEYLMTEGYIWTGQMPEAQRIIDKGNNQSMELDEETLKGFWANNEENDTKFFIINEAIISKLCILGEDYEPCFEGASIYKSPIDAYDYYKLNKEEHLEENNNVKITFVKMAKELTEILLQDKGGEDRMNFKEYEVNMDSEVFKSVFSFIPSEYKIKTFMEDVEASKKFAVLENAEGNLFRLNLVEESEEYGDIEAFEFEGDFNFSYDEEAYADFAKKNKSEEEKEEPEDSETKHDDNSEEDEKEDEDEKNKNENKYSLEEISELENKISELENKLSDFSTKYSLLEEQNTELLNFKKASDRKEKEEMINSFFMLSDEEKKDVVDNIDNYSLEDIEAKLSIIYVRNKVNFEDNSNNKDTYYDTTNDNDFEDIPTWLQRADKIEHNSL